MPKVSITDTRGNGGEPAGKRLHVSTAVRKAVFSGLHEVHGTTGCVADHHRQACRHGLVDHESPGLA